MSKPMPKFITLTAESVTIALSKPVELNGIKCDNITLRAPTVRDIRNSTRTSDGDDEQRELNLFASLAEVGVKDLEGLAYKDYNRVATGYTFLVRDDEF
ncbi:tail assembly chaperone E/41/14-like protein [Pseudomonas putida]|uniref:phage tail assembly protein n=1 Tax=Pseudomonas putida TaxID=303 RepID=UPI00104C0E88|nr:phage tail assembly protein [Pseudomonas putida]TCP73439.1 tail assembly chaperone E/41/14-like protein [Pseudomonas putida]